MKHKP